MEEVYGGTLGDFGEFGNISLTPPSDLFLVSRGLLNGLATLPNKKHKELRTCGASKPGFEGSKSEM